MAPTEGDVGAFLRQMTRGPASERRVLPFVGVDECFNRPAINQLTSDLLRRGLIDRARMTNRHRVSRLAAARRFDTPLITADRIFRDRTSPFDARVALLVGCEGN